MTERTVCSTIGLVFAFAFVAGCDCGAPGTASGTEPGIGPASRKPSAPVAAQPDPELERLIRETDAGRPERARRLACLELGRRGGAQARDRLLDLLNERTGDPSRDGPTHLYAAAGLALLNDAGTAIDLVLALSSVNPDDNVAALASEERNKEYWTVDAQIADALLGMGLWTAEEDLVRQMRRRDRIRVLIDAYAVLRRHSGLTIPFRYNGSYETRNRDADDWLKALRASRAQRARERPFDRDDPRFRKRCGEVIAWLGGQSMNNRLMAHRTLVVVGPPATPQLLGALHSDNPIAQRQAALMLGRIGDVSAAPALRAALDHDDDDARAEAIDALRRIRDRGGRDRIATLLADRDAEVRAAAADYLGRLGDPAVHRGVLRAALGKEKGPGTRTALLCALLRLGETDVRAALIEIFLDGEQLDRQAALDALLEIDPIEPVPSVLAPRAERQVVAERLAKRKK